MEDLILGALSEAIKMSPAVVILFFQAYRADQRAQECLNRLLDHLDREH